jgi:8-oxo-dGTP pyrophosphatase MutT (NUDIX family)
VISPEHKILEKIKNKELKVSNLKEIEKYLDEVKNKSEIERTDIKKEKTGVKINSLFAINKANNEKIPVFVADYVLGNYGTGAVMAVPAHDQRDFEFAKKYNLPKREVVIPKLIDLKNPHVKGKEIVYREAIIGVLLNPKNNKVLCLKWKKQPWTTFVMGGVEEGENPVDSAIREIREETGYKNIKFIKILGEAQSEFFAAHKDVNRVAHTHNILFHLIDEERDVVKKEEEEIHSAVWLWLETRGTVSARKR